VKIFFGFILLVLGFTTIAQDYLQPIGQWREQLPYSSTIDLTAGNNKIYAATPYSIFAVNLSDNSIERMSKITGLSETGISSILYDEANQKLVIAYSNSNIDIIYRNDIFNIPEIKRENINADKTINRIFAWNNNYYLSTGLGVIVVNGTKYEIKDSWYIGNTGGFTKVNGFTADGSFFYAATEEGLKRTSASSGNPANFQNWQLMSGLTAGACQHVISIPNKIIVQKNDSLFQWNGSNFSLFHADGWQITNMNYTGGKIALSQRQINGNARVTILNTDGSIARTLQQANIITRPRNAVFFKNDYWVADENKALSQHSTSSVKQYRPNSPDGIVSGEMLVKNNIFYAAAGAVDANWNAKQNGNGLYKFGSGNWTNYNRSNFSKLDSVYDLITVTIDPVDESIWAGSFGGGILQIKKDGSMDILKQNSPISPAISNPLSYRVSGLAFDADQNLWVSNFGAAQPFLVKKKTGGWKSFTPAFNLNTNALSQILIDDVNQKWIVSPLGNGLICFNHGSSIDNGNDDKWKIYKIGTGNGNLPSNDVRCMAKDKSGFIWIGTADGIAVIQCPEEAFTSSGCDAILPIVKQGNFAGLLFKGEDVRSIAVDGADRKWVATLNGVWLISADGEKIIYRLTEDNSKLLSNNVNNIAIDGKTGEVYFATAKGICSFRSTATEGGAKNENVLVFPNPVPPGYSGSIAIRGLVDQAVVKITELNGRLVHQTIALGGQAIWDGKDYQGKRIATGVYLVLISDVNKQEKTAAKIVFTSK
jgi:hypothetical protein